MNDIFGSGNFLHKFGYKYSANTHDFFNILKYVAKFRTKTSAEV